MATSGQWAEIILKDIIVNNKSETLHVRLTEDEHIAFKKCADELGVKRSELLRKMVRELVNQPYPDLLHDEQSMLRVVIRYLAGISRNLNQIAAAINTGKLAHRSVDNHYLNEIKHHVDEVKSEFLTYINITRKRLIVSKE